MTKLIDGSKWMENLPKQKQICALKDIVIPGSHDSCSFSISKSLDISPSEPKWMKILVRIFGKLAKSIIYNWSVTQNLNVYQQLSAGVRYFDVRVALSPEDSKFRIVHGLYGGTLVDMLHALQQVKKFSSEHPKEIVFLDCNHFYNMDVKAHQKFASIIKVTFGKALRPPGTEGINVTLNELWDNNQNVIVVYHNDDVISENPSFWSGNEMYSPWANTASTSTLIKFLNTETESHSLPKGAFHVAQGLLSANTPILLLHLTSSLKATLALKATQAVTTWLQNVEKSTDHIFNIIIADFIDHDNFIPAVVGVNYVDKEF